MAAMAFLLVPKFIATIRAWLRPLAKDSGGNVRVLASAVFEIVLSTLIAPVQMLIQTRQILDILLGRDSGWEAQVRAGQMPPWRVVLRRHAIHVIAGIATLVVLAYLSPGNWSGCRPFWRADPVAPDLALVGEPGLWPLGAPPRPGHPEERNPPEILTAANALGFRIAGTLPGEGLAALGKGCGLRARVMALLPETPAGRPRSGSTRSRPVPRSPAPPPRPRR